MPEWSQDHLTYFAQIAAGNFGYDGAPDLVYGITRIAGGGGYPLIRHVYGSWQSGFGDDGATVMPFTPDADVFPARLFTESNDFPTNAGLPQRSLAIDLDGDGYRDVVTGTGDSAAGIGTASASLVLWHNENSTGLGLPSLIARARHPISGYPRDMTSADFNGDGLADLAIATDAGVQIEFNTGALGFTDGPLLTTPTMNLPVAIVTADFNGDGIPDLAAASTGPVVSVWLGNGASGVGDGTFATGSEVSTDAQIAGYTTAGYYPRGMAVCDLNSDGHADLVIGNSNASGRRLAVAALRRWHRRVSERARCPRAEQRPHRFSELQDRNGRLRGFRQRRHPRCCRGRRMRRHLPVIRLMALCFMAKAQMVSATARSAIKPTFRASAPCTIRFNLAKSAISIRMACVDLAVATWASGGTALMRGSGNRGAPFRSRSEFSDRRK